MVDSRWVCPADERALGIEFYSTESPGMGGRLKQTPSDFRVQELSAYPVPDPDGTVTILRVESQGWEQHELSDRIARELGLAPHSIRWAGTKDRRAVADRLLSYRGLPPDPERLRIPGVVVRETYRAREELVLGHHYGNRFDIRLRELPGLPETILERAQQVQSEIEAQRGFPNFFGPQRFGEVRPITHLVGRALVQGNPALAVDLYLCARVSGEQPLGESARESYAEHRDPARALREFPPSLRFERQLLDHLARGHPPDRALRALGRPLRTLFVHAYQAHLFNRYLSARRAAGLSLTDPQPGDWLLRVHRDGTVPGREPIPVTDDNLPEALALTSEEKARLASPLVGYDTPPLSGDGGRLLEELLVADGVGRPQFRMPATPDIASAGNWRPFWVPAPDVELSWDSDERGGALRFVFNLPRGSYATTLLREYTKRGASAREPAEPARPRDP